MADTGFACALLPDLPHARLPGLRYIPVPEAGTLSYGAAYLSTENSPPLRRFLTLLEGTMDGAGGGGEGHVT